MIAVVVAMAVFALGETLWSPTAPAVLNDLAPEHPEQDGRGDATGDLDLGDRDPDPDLGPSVEQHTH